MKRRPFLIGCALALSACLHLGAQDKLPNAVKIRVDPQVVVARISPDFLGLGYETSAVAQANYFTAKNATLVRLYRNLSSHGLVRIGGIISDHAKYVPEGVAAANSHRGVTVFNRANLVDFGGFLRVTGWKAMWGLNLETGSKAEAAQEAAAVAEALRDRLYSLEVGNEVEARFGSKPAAQRYEAYHAAYLEYKAAVRAVVPQAPFSGPDTAWSFDYCAKFAGSEAGDLKLLTTHYYRGGAGDPTSTIEKLLKHDDGWERKLMQLRQLSREKNVPFRINEVNSFSGGGKKGVSDTFASALWCLDYMFLLASYDCEGVNMETDINQLGFISDYSPIVHDATGHCSSRPEYYAMLAFAMAGKGDLLKVISEKGGAHMTAYAAKDEHGTLWLTVINLDPARDVHVEASLPDGFASAEVFRLKAPSAESKDQVTFAGSQVSADGHWTAGPAEKMTSTNGQVAILLPRASAAVLRLGR